MTETDDPDVTDEPPMSEPATAAITVSGSAKSHPLLRWWSWPILATIVFLLVQPLISSGWALFSDSYRYAKQAELYLGETPEQASALALDAYCENKTWYRTWDGKASRTWTGWVAIDDTPQQHAARVTQCFDTYGPRGGDLTTTDPRYQSIFTSRPGYPLIATPFVGAFGIVDGMRLLGLVIATGGGIAVYALLRMLKLRPGAAVLGQAIYLLSPMGWWALQALGEGLVNVVIIGLLGGILLLRSGRTRPGIALMIVCYAALMAVRFSSVLLVGLALALACVLTAWWVDRDRPEVRKRSLIGALISVIAVAVIAVAMPVLGLPGAEVTLQDTFTRHFADPLVPNPWYRLAAANYHFWPQWLATPSASWLLLACSLAGVVVLLRWRRDLLWFALGLAGAGWAHVAAHPLAQEAQRLGLLMWMPAVIGLSVAAHLVIGGVRQRAAKAQ